MNKNRAHTFDDRVIIICNMDNTINLKNISENEAWIILYLLLLDKDYYNNKQWDDFKEQLIYKNRFYSNHQIVQEIRNRSDLCKRVLKKDELFYRARKYNISDHRKQTIKYILKEIGKTKEEIEILMKEPEYLQELLLCPEIIEFANTNLENDKASVQLKAAWKKWKKNVRFKGYNRKDSAAPPANKASCGRVNPANISYLYLSEDKETPIYEMRPIIGQEISIAKIRLNKDVTIYDLTTNITGNTEGDDCSLFLTIGKMFSSPNDGNDLDYLPTQFLAEEIKRMGFEGLRFNSALHEGGVNVVLFNPEDCTVISSDIKIIKNISIKARPLE